MSARAWFTAAALAALIVSAWPSAGAAVTPADSAASAAPAMIPITALPQPAPDFPRGRISGYMFGDLYYDLDGDPKHLYDSKGVDQGQSNIDGKKNIGRDLTGVQFRRVYFQLDNDLTARVATRFRLEMDGKELTSGGKLAVFVKNAYLQVRSVIPRGDVLFGELSTPTFENSEAFWQYRSVEKTVADFWSVRNSADLGLQLRGWLDGDHHVGYNAMVGDGNGPKPETDRFKTFYFSAPLRWGDLRLEPYADYQPVRIDAGKAATSDTVVNNDQATYKVFAGYEFRRWALGLEALSRVSHQAGKPNQEPRALSVFARGTFHPLLAGFARLDEWRTDVRTARRVDTRLWIAGLDWQPVKDVHLMPNVEIAQYVSRGGAVLPASQAHHDVQARITLYYLFSRPLS